MGLYKTKKSNRQTMPEVYQKLNTELELPNRAFAVCHIKFQILNRTSNLLFQNLLFV